MQQEWEEIASIAGFEGKQRKQGKLLCVITILGLV
jgi:hypothetical protein